MELSENIGGGNYEVGTCHFENYWGEMLVRVEITHFISGVVFTSERKAVSKILYNIQDKTKVSNIFTFLHTNGDAENYDYWRIKITTNSGKVYKSKSRFYCSLSSSDENNVILGVNGDAESLYVAFPSSSGCSTDLKLI